MLLRVKYGNKKKSDIDLYLIEHTIDTSNDNFHFR